MVGEIEIDHKNFRVIAHLKPSVTIQTSEELDAEKDKMMGFATEEIRKYHFNKDHWHSNSPLCLLSKSPRDMGGREDRIKIYSMSTPVGTIVSETDKIDFFISHSWMDDAELKRRAIVTFAEKFYREKARYPTFWFDKICIDQNDSTMGIAALPININACNGILILMGRTYLTRLWCIWELYTLFTFRNKDVVKSMVTILPLCISPDEIEGLRRQLRDFKVDDAHCFDPNEELKLRYLMLDVIGKDKGTGRDKVAESIRQMNLTVDFSSASAAFHSSKDSIGEIKSHGGVKDVTLSVGTVVMTRPPGQNALRESELTRVEADRNPMNSDDAVV